MRPSQLNDSENEENVTVLRRSSRIPKLNPRSLVSAIFHERNLDALVKKFKKFSGSYRFRCKRAIYEMTVSRLAAAKRFSSIEEIINHQKKFSDISKEGFTIRLISLYGKANMFDHARKLFDELPQLNSPRTVKLFNALLTAGSDSKEYETVTKIFHELAAECAVKPNVFSYNILIQAFCKMGSLDQAFSVLESMEENGVTPNLITFNTLLNGFYSCNQYTDAEKIWAEMQRIGCVPDIISYNAKLRGMVSEGKLEEAVELVDELRDRGPKPDIFSFNALIKGYCTDGKLEEAKKIYKELLANKCAPNRWTFESLIPFVSDKGDLELAMKLCKESISRKCSIDVGIVQGVVDALVRESRTEEAKKLVEIGVSKDYRYSGLKLPSAENDIYLAV
ncbi:hypothetical protein MRB53_022342 [Persea americana]|uniref:Uncharacterized protein n=1 Tax=Persea americana TaxID=3435 RepID=A0ACC2L6F2_PERAE|nr:hypothetical protein MRB53_022342 [Persea americana]